jgi:hypothetical protein
MNPYERAALDSQLAAIAVFLDARGMHEAATYVRSALNALRSSVRTGRPAS